jgi:hypothetical protein
VSSEEIAVGPYSDDADDEDDVVTLQMDTPLDDGEWMLQTSAYERRRLSTEQLSAERASGELPLSTRVWRNGMRAWTPLGDVDLSAAEGVAAAAVAGSAAPKGGATPTPKVSSEKPGLEEPAASGTRPLVPALAAPVKRAVLPLPSPPPPRMAPSPSRPGAAPASSPVLGLGSSDTPASARALGSSPSSALGFGARRALGLSPPPPRVEVRSEPVSAALPAFDAPPLEAQPGARRVDTATSVALDLGPAAPRRSRPWGGLVAQGAAAALALLGTSYALTRAGVFEPGATAPARQEVPASARLALQPVPAPAESIPAASASIPAVAPPAASEPVTVEQESAAAPAATADVSAASEPPAAAALPPAASKVVASKTVSKAAVSKAAVSKAAVSKAAVSKAAAPAVVSAVAASPAAEAGPSASAVEAPAGTKEASEKSDGAQKPAAETAAAGGDSATAGPGSPDTSSPRAARRAAAAEARRQRRAARAAGAAAPRAEPGEAATPPLEPGSTFDRQAAQAALTAAADQAKNCRPIGGPSGAGTVQVQYEPTGRVGSVTIVTPGFENSDAGACIQMLFRRARVPAFSGAKGAVMRQRFEIP